MATAAATAGHSVLQFARGARGRDPATGLTESHDLLVEACPSCTRRPIDACFWRTTGVTVASLAADGILAMDSRGCTTACPRWLQHRRGAFPGNTLETASSAECCVLLATNIASLPRTSAGVFHRKQRPTADSRPFGQCLRARAGRGGSAPRLSRIAPGRYRRGCRGRDHGQAIRRGRRFQCARERARA